MDVLFCDFTGIYGIEGFRDYGNFIDMKELSGTGMYVDEEAERVIRKRLDETADLSKYRIRFLDNGNYHYMTRILASYIREPFDLITFDNHTDDKPPAFEGLRSCGSWRLDIASENEYLNASMLVRRCSDFEAEYTESNLPLYISLDKDILSETVLNTNWDQGDMKEDELFGILKKLYDSRNVIALDVCGEDLPEEPFVANKRFNEKMIGLFGGQNESGRCYFQEDVRGYPGARHG